MEARLTMFKKHSKRSTSKMYILDYLWGSPGSTLKAITQTIGSTPSHTKRWLSELIEQGHVVMTGSHPRRYSLGDEHVNVVAAYHDEATEIDDDLLSIEEGILCQ